MPTSAPLRSGAGAPGAALERTTPVTIIVVDDDEAVCRSLKLMLRANGYRVHSYVSGVQLLQGELPTGADILLVDYVMPGVDGLELVRRLRERGWQGAAVLITGLYTSALAARAAAEGVMVVLEKPLDRRALLAVLEEQSG